MRKKHVIRNIVLLMTTVVICPACKTATPISLLCNDPNLQIFVDNEYIGKGQVSYTAAPGVQEVTVDCKNEGIPVYTKKLYIKGCKNRLFDLNVPKNLNYSTNSQIKSRTR